MGFVDWLHNIYRLEDTPTQAAYKNDNKRMKVMRAIGADDPNSGLTDYQFLHRVAQERGYTESEGTSGFAYNPTDADELAVARSLDKGHYRADGGKLSPGDILRLQTTPMWRKGK